MSQLDALWVYQQADLEVDKYEAEIRQNPMRIKLVRLKNSYKEQQDAMRAVEQDAQVSSKNLQKLSDSYQALKSQVDAACGALDAGDFESAAQVSQAIAQVNDLSAKLGQLSGKIEMLMKDVAKLAPTLRTARQKAAQARDEYAALKEEYDAEFAKQSEKLNELVALRDSKKDGISMPLLRKYDTIKKRATPPVAQLTDKKCGGCNMGLPAVSLAALRTPGAIVECETCGRIIYTNE